MLQDSGLPRFLCKQTTNKSSLELKATVFAIMQTTTFHTHAVIFAALFSLTIQAQLPSDYQICSRNDKHFKTCLRDSVQDILPKLKNGLKELNLSPLDPVVIPEVTIAEGTSAVRFAQKFKNFKIHNITTSIITAADAKFEKDKMTIDVDSQAEELVFESEYEVSGKVLLLPIFGNGKCLITLKNVKSHVHVDADEILKKNVKYFSVTGLTIKADISRLVLQFDNLFNGNKQLGDSINQVLNDNWKELYNDLGRNYEELFENVYRDYFSKIFSKIPADMLFPQ